MIRRCLCGLAAALLLPLAGCGQGSADQASGPAPALASVATPPAPIAENEMLHFIGTEPFWGGEVNGARLTYSTPDNQAGTTIMVARSMAPGSVAFSGTLDGKPFALSIATPQCSDGMSDRRYPFTATLEVGGEVRHGCAWSDTQPAVGPDKP